MKMSLLRAPFNTLCSGLFVWLVFPALLCSAELQVGVASVDITPNKAVALWGQFGLRLSTKPDTPLTARDWHYGVVKRYEQLQKNPDATYPVEIHVVRLWQ